MPNLFSDHRFPGLKIAIAQLLVIPGDVTGNTANIMTEITKARACGADIIVFPELAVTGYLLGDRFEEEDFLHEITHANQMIAAASEDIIVIWGTVITDFEKRGEDGRARKYNAACIAKDGCSVSNGLLLGYVPKTNLPKYRIFDDARHFTPSQTLAQEVDIPLASLLFPFRIKLPSSGETIALGLTICEDLWEDDYANKPSQIYAENAADIIINLSCSPWTEGKTGARDHMLKKRARESKLPILYVNAVGLQNNVKNLIWFDGGSTAVHSDGEIIWRMPQHEASLGYLHGMIHEEPKEPLSGVAECHAPLIAAMKQFYAPFKKVVVGLSGGIDSAVQLALLVEAIGAPKVLAINMPTKFNSNTTQDLAKKCASNLGVEYIVIPIQPIVDVIKEALAKAGFSNLPSLVEENIQARTRSADILAAVAQTLGGVFTCNGNKTEMALNYFTLYGDGAGASAFLADFWKGEIYDLANYLNEQAGRELVSMGIIDVIPSAELSADQNVDEGKGDPIFYPYHDNLLRAFTELRWTPATVMQHLIEGNLEEKLNCAGGTLRKYFKTRKQFVDNLEWAWERYNIEWKRGQTAPCFLVSRRAFGSDRRSTIAPSHTSLEYERLVYLYLHTEDGNCRIGI